MLTSRTVVQMISVFSVVRGTILSRGLVIISMTVRNTVVETEQFREAVLEVCVIVDWSLSADIGTFWKNLVVTPSIDRVCSLAVGSRGGLEVWRNDCFARAVLAQVISRMFIVLMISLGTRLVGTTGTVGDGRLVGTLLSSRIGRLTVPSIVVMMMFRDKVTKGLNVPQWAWSTLIRVMKMAIVIIRVGYRGSEVNRS